MGLEMKQKTVSQEMEQLCKQVMVLTVKNRMLRGQLLKK
jgi:hypothetical protein